MHEAGERTWANPASVHRAGRAAKAIVETARERIGGLLGVCSRDVVLTSGGTEANNLALLRPFVAGDGALRSGVLITSRLEHPSIVRVAEALQSRGIDVRWADAPETGRIEPEALVPLLRAVAPKSPVLVAVQSVNHETGVIQPIAAIAEVVHAHGAALHVDAVQAAGKLEPSVWMGSDTISVAAHKLRGPKGVGALGFQAGSAPVPLLRGGTQERGLRPGTVDPMLAAGFGAAVALAEDGPSRYAGVGALRDRLERALAEVGHRTGHRATTHGAGPRAPHVINLRFDGWEGAELVAALDLEGVCVAAGSACAAGTPEPSPVISAMCGREAARGAVRISLGDATTLEEVDRAIAVFFRVLGRHSAPG